ncbi:MAG: UvrD-helicase domain-containing protein, partial [Desulfobacterales bacterium]|nr:UvrD-helicase domain-containing protein [Desulfobacterales bacterium]
AVAWLERAGFLLRDENSTRVFQGRPSLKSMEEAKTRISTLHLSPFQESCWLAVFEAMMNAETNKGLRADDLAELPVFKQNDANRKRGETASHEKESASSRVIRTLHGMAEAGLVEKGLVLSAFVRHKVHNSPVEMLKRICAIEECMLNVFQWEGSDISEEGWNQLSLRIVNQKLKDLGHECAPGVLKGLLKSLSMDGKGLAGSTGSLVYKHISRDQYRVKLLRNWDGLVTTAKRRIAVASVVLDAILSRIPPNAPPSADLLVEFSIEDLTKAIRSNLFLRQEVKDPLAAVDRALLYLHEQKIIILQDGLAVFRQAMTIRILPNSRKGRYLKGDYEPLANHYEERKFQIHVINEYAQLGLQKIRQALDFVLAYFSMPKASFVQRFFPDRREMLDRATSLESFRRIVDDLANPVQMGVVAAPVEGNTLILAGPGSGKTRVVVHRCAYLLRVLRMPARSILVVCFNHNAAVALRKRLFELVGDDARGVIVATYHGLAMILTGTSFYGLAERSRSEEMQFDRLIPEAIRLLRGEMLLPGLAPDEMRDRLLEGFRHILVDEYQDIDEAQYEFISALAGRKEQDPDCKLSILAVGDDDQNIYTFRGANVEFIRRFQKDYDAQVNYLTWNYRSTKNIIDASNSLIVHNRDRMKIQYPIIIDKDRNRDRPGGDWESLDPVCNGRVQIIEVRDAKDQIAALMAEIRRMRGIKPDLEWSDFAVISRTREWLHQVRAMCELYNIPFAWTFGREAVPPLQRLREVVRFSDMLKVRYKERMRASEIQVILSQVAGNRGQNPWFSLIAELLRAYEQETGDASLPVFSFMESLYDSLVELKREQSIGNGVFLGTLHGAKGMEFPHVFILDGGWREEVDAQRREEERRVFYVGMTRARQTLCLFKRKDLKNPHVGFVTGDSVINRRLVGLERIPEKVMSLRYEPLSLADLYISSAGKYSEKHPIHNHLCMLEPGAMLSMRRIEDKLGLFDDKGLCVAHLSKQGASQWLARLETVKAVRVIGMILREKKFEADEYRGQCHVDSWEVPWVEVAWASQD